MERINWNFSQKFGRHWVRVKFYKKKPNLKDAKRLEGVRFCEAIREAIVGPVLLDRDSISCEGAHHALGWRSNSKESFLDDCQGKNQVQTKVLKSLFSKIPYFKKPFDYIGLNTEGKPDLIMSFVTPDGVKDMLKIYNNRLGKTLDVSLCNMMSICSGIAVKTYQEGKVSLSFGCDDSRRYAGLSRDTLAVGVPNKLFKVFVD